MKKKIAIPVLALVITLPLLLLFFTSCGKSDEQPHILLITIDTLRSDHLGSHGYVRKTSPFMDQLAKEGTRFKHAVSTTNGTAGSHASILTSLHPVTHGIMTNGLKLPQKAQSIAEKLKQNGYYTAGAISVKILSSRYQFNQGFDAFSEEWKRKGKKDDHYQRHAATTNSDVFKQIDGYLAAQKGKDKKQPLFIWVHYFDPHWPYLEWEEFSFKNKLSNPDQEMRKPMRRYDKEIRFLDGQIKELYAYLDKKGLKKRLVSCITADHGEHFGEHGHANCHVDMYTETLWVPMIFHGWGIPSNKTVDTYISTMDAAVTLLGKAGLTFDYKTEGIDLFKKLDDTGKIPERRFLIAGHQLHTRSFQMIGDQYAYFLNFDYHYKSWHVSYKDKNAVPEDRFTVIKAEKSSTKGGADQFDAVIPRKLFQGRKYAVIRIDIKKNEGLVLTPRTLPRPALGKFVLEQKEKTDYIDIICPVTMTDNMAIKIHPKNGTEINGDGIRFAILSKEEVFGKDKFKGKINLKNNVNNSIDAIRKKTKHDEFYDLRTDLYMTKNLITERKHRKKIIQSRKLVYAVFKYYFQKQKKLLKGLKVKSNYSEKEKKMLKSLGYL